MRYLEDEVPGPECFSGISRTSYENDKNSKTTDKDCGIREDEQDSDKYDRDGHRAAAGHIVGSTTELNITTPADAIKRKWYNKLNIVGRRVVPKTPGERIVSREYKAGFLSKLTFQWMTPLITVRSFAPRQRFA